VYTPPPNLEALLDPLPPGVELVGDGPYDLALCFATRSEDLAQQVSEALSQIPAHGAIWTCWPKRASKVPTDITENVCRDLFLGRGLVDVKVCAIDDVWSGLKFVIRKELRSSRP
jgi:hypothetical protein